MQRRTLRALVGLVLVAMFAAHAARYLPLPLFDRLEAIAYDARVRLSTRPAVDPNVVIVDIDEKSLAAEGRWPWPRGRIADLLDQLFDRYHVRIVGFDMVFAEPDISGGPQLFASLLRTEPNMPTEVKRRIQRMANQLDADQRLARALRDRSVVLGYYFSMGDLGNPNPRSGRLPVASLSGKSSPHPALAHMVDWAGYGANLEVLTHAAPAAGHFNYLPDLDGISRRIPLLARYDGDFYEALSLAMVRVLLGAQAVQVMNAQAAGGYARAESINLGEALSVPVDKSLSALVPYRAGAGGYAFVSASDVLKGAVPDTVLEDKIILIGTTAAGLVDLRATPVSISLPGVEIHANLISGMLDGSIKSEPPYVLGIELAALLLVGVLLAFALPYLAPLRATALFVLTLCAVVVGNWVLWEHWNLVVPVATGVSLIVLLYAMNMSFGYFEETHAKRQITGLFGQYVPPDLVREMSKDPGRFTLQGESRELTVLFTDVRGFTTISEGMEPRELTQLMNEFLTPLSRVVYQQHGTIDKYMGDCVMAFWGAPMPLTNHAELAVKAALRMQQEMAALKPRLQARGWPALSIGVGINTGRMSVGNMGSEVRVAYTVMGDAVNLASRLEGITKQYGVGIIVGQDTRAQVKGVVFRELDRVQVKGKQEPIAIFEPIGFERDFSAQMREELAQWHEALAQYRARRWDAAGELMTRLAERAPATALYQVYLARIAQFRQQPPESSWNGVYAFDSK